MAETLGMLCDKLTIVKLKQYHTEDGAALARLGIQAKELETEIDQYITDAIMGRIPAERLVFDSNKIYKKEGNETEEVTGNFGTLIYQLADVNCRLWHQQEKVYEFEKVPVGEKDKVVKQLALLNLERNNCIDAINKQLAELITKK
jgi:hypothetical protein